MSVAPKLSSDEVRRVAHLARLRPSDAEIERYRAQLASILEYVAQLQELDVEGVEPLTHPTPPTPPTSIDDSGAAINRIDQDEPQPPLPIEALQRNAPAMEGRYLAVPKVIADGEDG